MNLPSGSSDLPLLDPDWGQRDDISSDEDGEFSEEEVRLDALLSQVIRAHCLVSEETGLLLGPRRVLKAYIGRSLQH